jgi:proline iminopeptidase
MSNTLKLLQALVLLCYLRRVAALHTVAHTSLLFRTRTPSSHHISHHGYSVRLFASDYDISSVPCNQGTIQVTRELDGASNTYNLSYKLFRPMSLSSRQAAPIVALHGGPSVPCNYLTPLVKAVPYRSILFYDQLGCGESDEPTDVNAYSIDSAVSDLELVLQKLGIRRFHLYGQSFGGILAFEALKKWAEERRFDDIDDEGCLSAVLSSAPSDVRQVEEEAQRLLEALDDPTLFRETHQCRTLEMPEPLQQAYANAGTVWRGTSAIANYKATAPAEDASRMPSCMILRGQHDFVTEACTSNWENVLNNGKYGARNRVLEDCSHHGLLENPKAYGEMIGSFFAEYD